MALYVVVHHRNDVHPRWRGNIWIDDDRIASITTTPLVADQCRVADRVFVHRCGWRPRGGRPVGPVVSCVAVVDRISGTVEEPVIHFRDVAVVGKPVKRRLFGPTNSYFEAAP
jgi:hypothetical protein